MLSSLFLPLLPLFLSIVFLLKLKWLSPARRPHKKQPPSPPKLPIIGNLHQLGGFPHRSLRALAHKYGPIMHLRLGGAPVLVISSAEAAREIMKTHDLVFSSRPKSTIAGKLTYESKDVAFAPYGEYWRQMRSICVLHLLGNKRLQQVQSFCTVREEEIILMIEKIKQSSTSIVDLSEIMVSLTNDVVCRVTLGRKYSGGDGGTKFKEILGEFSQLLGVFNVGDYIPWLAWVNSISGLNDRVDKVAKRFDDFLESIIDEHMDSWRKKKNGGENVDGDQSNQDFVDVLLEIQRDNTAGFYVHKDSIKALILDMFAAGTDTTYIALEWVMAELLKHPKVMKELQNEVRGMAKGKDINQKGLPITEHDLEKMQYLKAVIKETMRLHPPTPLLVFRESTQDVQVMGYDIAVGTQVIVNSWAIGRDPSYWDEPEEFRPERFLNSSVDFKGHDFQLIPFGAGRRGCPGIQFARTMDEFALANLVYHFDFALPDGATEEDLDMSEISGITVHKRTPLLTIATPCSC